MRGPSYIKPLLQVQRSLKITQCMASRPYSLPNYCRMSSFAQGIKPLGGNTILSMEKLSLKKHYNNYVRLHMFTMLQT